MTLPLTVLKGSIVVQGVPDTACFTSFAQLLNSLGQYLSVEIAASSISNVIISNIQPGSADKDKIWFRLANSGVFVGIYKYSGTAWEQVLPAPQQVFILYGDSSNPPPGFVFIQDGDGTMTSAEYTLFIAQYGVLTGGVGPTYAVYPAKYVGV